jgi:hypothetical protein
MTDFGDTIGMSLEITEELIARQSPEAQAIIRLLLAQVARLEAKVADLESRLAKTPRNSSLPPSAQHPHAKPPTKKPKSKNKRGGQPGHPKHQRPLIPTDECDDVQSLKPRQCRRCARQALRPGPRSSAASGLGAAADQASGDRIPAPSIGLRRLR